MKKRQRLWIEAPIFFPKVRLMPQDDLLFLYRWFFTDSELLDLWKEGRFSLGCDLCAEISFLWDKKFHRRRDLACLVGQHGWLRVACGRTSINPRAAFLLYSAFNEIGEPLELAQIVPYFDFVKSHCPLDEIPDKVQKRMQLDLGRHIDLTRCKLKEDIRNNRKQELATIEEAYGQQTQAAEVRLKLLKESLVVWSGCEEGKKRLREEQQELRKKLLQLQEDEAEAVRQALMPNSGSSIKIETMLTLSWRIELNDDKSNHEKRKAD